MAAYRVALAHGARARRQEHGGRKVIIAPDSSDAWAPTKPRPDETLIRALARAHRWKRLLEECRYRSAGELAEADTRSFVNRLLRLTLLTPEIAEAILDTAAEGTAAGRPAEEVAYRLGGAAATACFPMMSGSFEARFVLPTP